MSVELYIELLKSEYNRRKTTNALYSLRSFAKSLNVDVSLLTKIFSRKRELSLKAAQTVSERLGLKDEKRMSFLMSVALCNSIRYLSRQGLNPKSQTWVNQLLQDCEKGTALEIKNGTYEEKQ